MSYATDLNAMRPQQQCVKNIVIQTLPNLGIEQCVTRPNYDITVTVVGGDVCVGDVSVFPLKRALASPALPYIVAGSIKITRAKKNNL